MFRKKKKNIFSRLLFNQYVVFAFFILILFLISVPLAKNISKKYEIDTEVRELESEILSLQKKNLELEKMIDDYESADFVEEIARLNLGLKKEGEEVLVVKTNNEEVVELDNYKIGDLKFAGDEKEGNPRKWLRYFLKN
ncbi:hypothetical protein C0584_05675 [Candidatus Parcubacteria bacterium]|nr:MAG: hypothetical protein C0584_05675 [Candidatus Parcubacteria bacterium]